MALTLDHLDTDDPEEVRRHTLDVTRNWCHVALWQAERVRHSVHRLTKTSLERLEPGVVYDPTVFAEADAERFFLFHAARQVSRGVWALTDHSEPVRTQLQSELDATIVTLRNAWEHWDNLNNRTRRQLEELGDGVAPSKVSWHTSTSHEVGEVKIGGAFSLGELEVRTRWTRDYLDLLAETPTFLRNGWGCAPEPADPPT